MIMTLTEAVEASLATTDDAERDRGTAQLAREYARQIDARPVMLKALGPPLLACLEQMLLTPKARGTKPPEEKPDVSAAATKLDELRRRRADRAANLDASTS